MKKDAIERLLKATDGVQTAEVEVPDEGKRKSRIVSTADVTQDYKEKDLAALIIKTFTKKPMPNAN